MRPDTTALSGENGDIYFHCAGMVTSTHLWLSTDPTGRQSESDFTTEGGRWDALAKIQGDTLLVYADWRFEEPNDASLPYVLVYRKLEQETFGMHPNQVYQNPGQFGLTHVAC